MGQTAFHEEWRRGWWWWWFGVMEGGGETKHKAQTQHSAQASRSILRMRILTSDLNNCISILYWENIGQLCIGQLRIGVIWIAEIRIEVF